MTRLRIARLGLAGMLALACSGERQPERGEAGRAPVAEASRSERSAPGAAASAAPSAVSPSEAVDRATAGTPPPAPPIAEVEAAAPAPPPAPPIAEVEAAAPPPPPADAKTDAAPAAGQAVAVADTKPGLTRVGATKCKICHKVQYASWAESKHAERDPPLDCESCHGSGSEYKKKSIMQDPELARAAGLVIPGKSFCANCHLDDWQDDMLQRAHAHEPDEAG